MKALPFRSKLIATRKLTPAESIPFLKNSWESGIGSIGWSAKKPLSGSIQFMRSWLGSKVVLSHPSLYPQFSRTTSSRR